MSSLVRLHGRRRSACAERNSAVLCFRDFRHLSQGVESLLDEEGREREALGAILICIALLDGARAAGLDYFLMNTGRPLDEGLREYLGIRQGRL